MTYEEFRVRPAMGSQVEKLLHFQICRGTNNQEIQLEQEELEIT